jgi:hypothetical protein
MFGWAKEARKEKLKVNVKRMKLKVKVIKKVEG